MRGLDATCDRVLSLAAVGFLRVATTLVLIAVFSPTLQAVNVGSAEGSTTIGPQARTGPHFLASLR